MGLFNDLTETGRSIKQLANDASTKSQIQTEIKKKEKKLESLIYRIGSELVSSEPQFCETRFNEIYMQIVEARSEVKGLRDKIKLMEQEVVCPGCGKVVRGDAKFCNSCGNRLQDPSAATTLSGEMCQACGALIKKGAAFCVNCGSAIQYIPQEEIEQEEAGIDYYQDDQTNRTCVNCGAEVNEGNEFCTNCGTPVVE